MSATTQSNRRMNFRQRKVDTDKSLPVIFLKTDNDEQELESLNLTDKTSKNKSSLSSTLLQNGTVSLDDNSNANDEMGREDESTENRTTAKVIPVPLVNVKENLEYVNVHFDQPRYYIRYYGQSYDQELQAVVYDLEEDDFAFIDNLNAKLEKENAANSNNNKNSNNMRNLKDTSSKNHYTDSGSTAKSMTTFAPISESILEECIDRFERTTAFSKSLCTLQDVIKQYPNVSKLVRPKVLNQIYHYWREKRMRRVFEYDRGMYKTCGKPLLEEFVLPPDMDDPNPAVAFRPREREKAPRKQRMNNMDSYQRLQQMRADLIKLKQVLEKVHQRESQKRDFCKLTKEIIFREIGVMEDQPSVTSVTTEPIPEESIDRNQKRKLEEITPDVVNELPRKRHKKYKEPKMKELNLSDLVKQPPKVPIFSFLVKLKKTGSFEGDEPIDAMNEDPRQAPNCYLGRGGRILFERSDTQNNPTKRQESHLESLLLQQERSQYRRLNVSNQKRIVHKFACDDAFGFEDPDEEDLSIPDVPLATTTTLAFPITTETKQPMQETISITAHQTPTETISQPAGVSRDHPKMEDKITTTSANILTHVTLATTTTENGAI